jgi:murein DD-endopeptidase MepM/ murein hydrolase activator NlpD
MAKMPMPFREWYTYDGHSGIDFPNPEFTPIPAITDGTITYSGWWNPRAGFTKTITRGDGLQIMHCHLPNLNGVSVGARVVLGQKFAYVGNTGFSTGPHLHLEMWLNSKPQNEWDWMDRHSWIGQGSGAGGGGTPLPIPPKPSPEPVPIMEDDDMNPIYWQKIGTNGVYALDTISGNRRLLTAGEWQKVQAAYEAAKRPVPFARVP